MKQSLSERVQLAITIGPIMLVAGFLLWLVPFYTLLVVSAFVLVMVFVVGVSVNYYKYLAAAQANLALKTKQRAKYEAHMAATESQRVATAEHNRAEYTIIRWSNLKDLF